MSPMYWWALLAMCVGVLAGFQGIYLRHPTYAMRLCSRPLGAWYLATRGAVPGAAFAAIYSAGYFSLDPWFLAIVVGVSAEGILRTKVFVTQAKDEEEIKDLLYGPFSLLQWYQELFLVRMGTDVAAWRKKKAQSYIDLSVNLDKFVTRLRDNANLMNGKRDIIIKAIESTTNDAGEDVNTCQLRLIYSLSSFLNESEMDIVCQKQ